MEGAGVILMLILIFCAGLDLGCAVVKDNFVSSCNKIEKVIVSDKVYNCHKEDVK